MKRTNANGHITNLFTDGDADNGIQATVVDASWLNAVQQEICTVIEDAGITLNGAAINQLKLAIAVMIAASGGTYASNAEAFAGLISNKSLVPSNFVNSLGTSGYQKFPGGIILQWGTISVIEDFTAVATLPTAYNTACYIAHAVGTVDRTSSAVQRQTAINTIAMSATQVTFANDDITQTVLYFTLGK